MEYVNQAKGEPGWFRKCLNQLGSHKKGLQKSFSLFVIWHTFLFIKYAFDHTYANIKSVVFAKKVGKQRRGWENLVFIWNISCRTTTSFSCRPFCHKICRFCRSTEGQGSLTTTNVVREGINWIKQLPPSLPLLFNTTLQISDYRFFYFLAGRVGGSLYLSCGRH